MAFIKDLYHDEIREDFLVKSNIKKVWNRQLEIWAEVDRICRKHDITYWAIDGTLLDAARHKGFIPWDDDMDFAMFRPDYNRFVAALDDELRSAGSPFTLVSDYSMTKLVHGQTTALSADSHTPDKPTGLVADIFALDILEDDTRAGYAAANALREIYFVLTDASHVKNDTFTFNDKDFLKKISEITDVKDKVKFFSICAKNLFSQSNAVAWFNDTLNGKYKEAFRKEWFDETIYLPFETIELPAPKMFDEVLNAYYGDWRTPVYDGQARLGGLHSPDIPYKDFWRQADIAALSSKKIQGGLKNWLS